MTLERILREMPATAVLGLTALAFVAGCSGDKAIETPTPAATSTPYFTATPQATNTPMATTTPGRTYIPPSLEIPEENRNYLGSVVNLEDVLILCNGTSDGYSVPQYFMEKGAVVRAPVGGRIINIGTGEDATTVVNIIVIEYAPDTAVMVNFYGTASEELGHMAGYNISEGTVLGTIGDGLMKCGSYEANLQVLYYTQAFGNERSNIYADPSGNLFIPLIPQE
jgi:hypothetical protein